MAAAMAAEAAAEAAREIDWESSPWWPPRGSLWWPRRLSEAGAWVWARSAWGECVALGFFVVCEVKVGRCGAGEEGASASGGGAEVPLVGPAS